jgi:hypothetical protein
MPPRVHPGTERERLGQVVEDFGEMGGHIVDKSQTHIAGSARRWAVMVDDGSLVFVDSDQLGGA